jgi:hypothetical protein
VAVGNKPLKTDSFGACSFDSLSPTALDGKTNAINLALSFEEALKLNLAIDECVRKLNSYNRATSRGKNAAMRLIVHFDKGRIRVMEGALAHQKKR